jgi:hypothetical protein
MTLLIDFHFFSNANALRDSLPNPNTSRNRHHTRLKRQRQPFFFALHTAYAPHCKHSYNTRTYVRDDDRLQTFYQNQNKQTMGGVGLFFFSLFSFSKIVVKYATLKAGYSSLRYSFPPHCYSPWSSSYVFPQINILKSITHLESHTLDSDHHVFRSRMRLYQPNRSM